MDASKIILLKDLEEAEKEAKKKSLLKRQTKET